MNEQVFKNYEKKVLDILVSNNLPSGNLADIIQNVELVDYEYTGSGYFLTVRHPNLPKSRNVCDRPILIGEAENIVCGFIVFLENNELILECHSWGEFEVTENFRETNVQLREFYES